MMGEQAQISPASDISQRIIGQDSGSKTRSHEIDTGTIDWGADASERNTGGARSQPNPIRLARHFGVSDIFLVTTGVLA
ncbi:MAG: hypothetical protein E6J82_19490 [Deltaproteobacteria bacterium]|nr:MAG: hypothetical protein E6J82_19490 [Deltaproteobacteria bacterium]